MGRGTAEKVQQRIHPDLGAERSAEILVARYGPNAFDFAARQAAILDLASAAASVEHWRRIARAIAELQSPRGTH